jgi:penicillin-binding protein 2
MALACTQPAPPRGEPGSQYVQALEPRLQNAAEQSLLASRKAGAIVALVPGTGQVVALFSVAGERGDPALVAHMPASAFKPFTGLAGLEAGAITGQTVKDCRGSYEFQDKTFVCVDRHGQQRVGLAIVHSCNGFFYELATEIDHQRVLDMARRFGFGSRTGIELADEPGFLPRAVGRSESQRGPADARPLLDAIGHGAITVTLLQFARAYSAIANGGPLPELHLEARRASSESNVRLQPEHLELVRRALLDSVEREDGTAHSVVIPGLPFAGKTGTGEAPPRSGHPPEDDTWFIAYAPPRAPEILVAARVERSDAAYNAKLAVRQILQAWRAR